MAYLLIVLVPFLAYTSLPLGLNGQLLLGPNKQWGPNKRVKSNKWGGRNKRDNGRGKGLEISIK